MTAILDVPPKRTDTIEYTPDDLLMMPDGDRYELVDGRLVERNMGQVSSWVGIQTARVIGNFAEPLQLGYVFGSDCGYQCFHWSPKRLRRPDVSFIRREKFPNGQMFDGHVPIVPDLVVEVISPVTSWKRPKLRSPNISEPA